MNTEAVLFELLRRAVCGAAMDEGLPEQCTQEVLTAAFRLARRHDLQHLVGYAAGQLKLPDGAVWKAAVYSAVCRQVQQSAELDRVCAALERAGIPHIPLKGAVIRAFYPQAWMRTSCDVDVLVPERLLDRALAVLTDNLDYQAGNKTDHDVTLTAKNGVHVELHYDTIQERYDTNRCRRVLQRIWEDAFAETAGGVRYSLSDEMYYFYHMAHMAKHFANGGCGIRAYLDIWILNHRVEFDSARREALLAEGGLLKFARASEGVAEHWFSGKDADEMTQCVCSYILRANLYGNNDNRAAIGQARMGGKGKYLLRRIFMPYDYLKAEYPILKKHKWLTPLYQVVRWLRMLFAGQLRRTMREVKANVSAGEAQTRDAAAILEYLGI